MRVHVRGEGGTQEGLCPRGLRSCRGGRGPAARDETFLSEALFFFEISAATASASPPPPHYQLRAGWWGSSRTAESIGGKGWGGGGLLGTSDLPTRGMGREEGWVASSKRVNTGMVELGGALSGSLEALSWEPWILAGAADLELFSD